MICVLGGHEASAAARVVARAGALLLCQWRNQWKPMHSSVLTFTQLTKTYINNTNKTI
jgi:hypothetical protein